MNEKINTTGISNAIIISRNPNYLSGQESLPFQVIIISNGEYLKNMSSYRKFATIEEAEECARKDSELYQINYRYEPGLEPE